MKRCEILFSHWREQRQTNKKKLKLFFWKEGNPWFTLLPPLSKVHTMTDLNLFYITQSSNTAVSYLQSPQPSLQTPSPFKFNRSSSARNTASAYRFWYSTISLTFSHVATITAPIVISNNSTPAPSFIFLESIHHQIEFHKLHHQEGLLSLAK